jgi:hypothetical protein
MSSHDFTHIQINTDFETQKEISSGPEEQYE